MSAKLTIDSTVTLNNGVKMPLLGFGAAEISPWTNEQERIVRNALDAGYKMIDTALGYQTEHGVAAAIKSSGIDREDLFITTKCPCQAIRVGAKEIVHSLEDSLRNLQTDYIDLYLIHWPPQGRTQDAWRLMEYFYYSGRVRALGISNMNRRQWLEIMAKCEVKPQVQQDEFNPLRMNEYNRIYCEHQNIHFEAFLPVCRGKLRKHPILVDIAEKYGKNTFQVILRWDIQHGISTIPRSTDRAHTFSNADIFDFELSAEDMARIDSLNVEAQMNRDMDNFNF